MEKPPSSFQVGCHVHVEPLLIVAFPYWVVGVGLSFYLHVSSDGCLSGVHQVAFFAICLSVEYPVVPIEGFKVFLRLPFVGFLGMSSVHPSSQFSIDGIIYCFEDFPTHYMLVILRATANDRVELHNEFASR